MDEQPTSHTADLDPLDLIRQAASKMREYVALTTERWGADWRGLAAQRAVAAWLDTAGADLWAHGPLCCAEGCMECDDSLWMPHVRRAIAVARAYLDDLYRFNPPEHVGDDQ